MISDHVIFSSQHFRIEVGEDAETNPGIFGRSLAAWVAGELVLRGVRVREVIAEDFGRVVQIEHPGLKLWVGCASVDGSSTRWQLFIGCEQNPLKAVFRRWESDAAIAALRVHYREMLNAVPGIADVEWQEATAGGT